MATRDDERRRPPGAGAAPRALIVTDGSTPCVVAASRGLGAAGWHVGLAVSGPPGPPTRSRWVRGVHPVPPAESRPEAFLAAVADLVRASRYDVVLAADDVELLVLSAGRDEIPCVIPHAPHAAVLAAVDKLQLTRAAVEAGLAAPETQPATDEVLRTVALPVVVKARLHWQPGEAGTTRHQLAAICTSRADAIRHAAEMRAAGAEPLAQACVDGELMALTTVIDRDGTAAAWVQQRTTRASLLRTSCQAETVALDEDLAARCEGLLRALGWFGLANLQFLRPAGGGEPQLIDLNGRFYGSLALAVAAGVNLPDVWARLALGGPRGPLVRARPGVGFQALAEDLRRARVERRGGLARDVARVLADMPRSAQLRESVQDPGPWLAVATGMLGRRLGREATAS